MLPVYDALLLLQAGLPEPQYEFTGFFTILFNRTKISETTQKTTRKTTQKILDILKTNPKAGRKEIAEIIGDITEDGIKYHLDKLKNEGIIKRIGAAKRWLLGVD